jgi:NADH:ubiquinone oxidoreductase subunit B-like Fe-S oxidoreductase
MLLVGQILVTFHYSFINFATFFVFIVYLCLFCCLVYKRPFAEEFMKFCLERFEVGIWSSACEKNVDIVLSIVLENLQDKLLFVWDQESVRTVDIKH